MGVCTFQILCRVSRVAAPDHHACVPPPQILYGLGPAYGAPRGRRGAPPQRPPGNGGGTLVCVYKQCCTATQPRPCCCFSRRSPSQRHSHGQRKQSLPRGRAASAPAGLSAIRQEPRGPAAICEARRAASPNPTDLACCGASVDTSAPHAMDRVPPAPAARRLRQRAACSLRGRPTDDSDEISSLLHSQLR